MKHDRFLMSLSVWSPLAYLLTFGFGWLVLARWFPPIAPTSSPLQVAEIFRNHHFVLELAAVSIMVSTVVLVPVSALLVLVIRKIEKQTSLLTLMAGFTLTCFLVLNFYAGFSFSTAAFRVERSPDLVQFASDAGFLQFIGGIPMFIMVWILTAYAVLVTDRGPEPIAPRWFGYLNLWIALLYLPELLVFFFKTGPFAWDGVIGFWIPAVLFIVYFLVAPFVLKPIVKRHFS